MRALTPQQVRVLREVAAGKLPKEMAGNAHTNEFHAMRLKAALGLKSYALLAQFALLTGLASWDARARKLARDFVAADLDLAAKLELRIEQRSFLKNPNHCLLSSL